MARAASGVLTAGALLCVLLVKGASGQEKGEAGMELIELTNGTLVVGVLPPLGGRVVELKAVRGENLLDSDPKRWKPPYPRPAIDTPLQPWNGRIVWVGPQTGFWSQQDLRPELKQAKAQWPPDPFNETGRFDVVEKTATRVKLKGTTSPVTGLAFEHEYEITGERTVRMKTTATNGRSTPVSWDLWPNTRARPEGAPYVPLDPMQMLRMDGPKPSEPEAGAYPDQVRAGWLTLAPGTTPQPPQKRLWAKAYVRPARGLIAYFLGRQLMLIRAPLVPKEKLHPEQAFIEIYRGAGKDATVLELEMHGPYETIAPGASTSVEQTFEILDYEGPADAAGHVARLEQLGK
jgi:Domain of unknown function (DUF4380)